MTTLAINPQRDSFLPSLLEDQIVVAGQPMGAVASRVLQARADFVAATRCRFWEDVVAAEFPDLLPSEYAWRATALRPHDLALAIEYSGAGLVLEPTELPGWDD